MDRYHHEGRLAAQRAFLVVASQGHPGTDLVGDFGVVLEAMAKITEPLIECFRESDPEMNEADVSRFQDGYNVEQKCLTKMLSQYFDRYKR